MDFLWTKGLTPPSFPTLNGDKTTEVLVIGGGMAGILCALQMQKNGMEVTLVEGSKIGSGITKGTTAVLTAQHDTLYQDFIKTFGEDKAKAYLNANLQAVESFRNMAKDIDCDFEDYSSIMYSTNNKQQMEQEVIALKKLGFQAEFITEIPLPFKIAGAVKYPNMAQFHPLKFLYAISKNLQIYESTFVEKIDGNTAITSHGKIYAKKIIIATHYPFINSQGLYFMKLYQQRSFVIALENAPKLDCTIEDVAENGIYLRNYKDLLLIGGGDHRTGKQGGSFAAPRKFASQYFPHAKEVMAWANQDCISLDGMPYIGQYSSGMPDVYVISGFNLWGMTSSMVASQILSDIITGRKNPFTETFSPHRNMIRGQLFANMGTTTLDFIIPTTKRCSHLGCALKWNPIEHSWDCPCHGSRFSSSGKLLDNPAMKDINIK